MYDLLTNKFNEEAKKFYSRLHGKLASHYNPLINNVYEYTFNSTLFGNLHHRLKMQTQNSNLFYR